MLYAQSTGTAISSYPNYKIPNNIVKHNKKRKIRMKYCSTTGLIIWQYHIYSRLRCPFWHLFNWVQHWFQIFVFWNQSDCNISWLKTKSHDVIKTGVFLVWTAVSVVDFLFFTLLNLRILCWIQIILWILSSACGGLSGVPLSSSWSCASCSWTVPVSSRIELWSDSSLLLSCLAVSGISLRWNRNFHHSTGKRPLRSGKHGRPGGEVERAVHKVDVRDRKLAKLLLDK